MPRLIFRFAALFVLGLAVLLGYHSLYAAQPDREVETDPPTAALTSKPGKAAPYLWWEAETPIATNFPHDNPFAPVNSKEAAVLSAGRWIGVDGPRSQPLFLEYTVTVPKAATYFFYTRKFWQHGPFRWRWDDRDWQSVGTSVYLMDSVGLRSSVGANWVSLNSVALDPGPHTLRIELTQNTGAAAFDCFVLTTAPLQPRGKLKPDQRYAANLPGWFLFDPEPDTFTASPIDLRFLNEAFAGEKGWIQVQGEAFVHEKTGQPERFWAVNVGMEALEMDSASLHYLARFLAKHGVNLVRLHGKLWSDDSQTITPATIESLMRTIAAFKQEGIYTALSIYFPLWLQLDPTSGFAGYSGQHPFSLLFFNAVFQQKYYGWWRSLLTTVNPRTGKALRDDPALAMVELVNEDSYFFWTFDPYQSIPAPQMAVLETQFGDWLAKKYGSIPAAWMAWSSLQEPPPQPGRVPLLPLYEVAAKADSRRAQDTAAFLMESQKQFFAAAIAFLHQDLHYNGLIYASNWLTADARKLGPLDKYTNTVADFMDRHGYFNSSHQGPQASYSLNAGDTYQDRSALPFTATEKGQEHDFNLPIMDIRYNGLPSTITEINWTPPNRFRAELPLLAAAYGSLQGSDGFFFFTSGSHSWEPSLGKFSIASPAVLGQFSAAALIYRRGLLEEGKAAVDISLKLEDLKALRGAPIAAPQNLDAFRAKDILTGKVFQSHQPDTIDPLAFLVGKVNLRFSNLASSQRLNLSSWIDRAAKTVRSLTGQLSWNYKQGLVTVNAPLAQGATGFFHRVGPISLKDVTLTSDLDYGTMLLVPLDEQPLARSQRMLLQVMSEEQNFGWKTSGYPVKTIQSVGSPPIVVRNLSGKVELRRSDAASFKVTALDANGYALAAVANSTSFQLLPNAFYYLIQTGQ